MNSEEPIGTIYVRRVFFLLSIFFLIATLGGVITMCMMEDQARAALPPDERTAEAIATIYDGAVCLSCDLGRMFIALFGSLAFAATLVAWGIYESGRRLLICWATPK